MLQIALLLISIIFSQAAFAQSKTPQTLEEITAGLKAKKAAMEPFKDKDVKVDLESLGLDDVDKKPAEQTVPSGVSNSAPNIVVDDLPKVSQPVKQEAPPSLPELPKVPEVKVPAILAPIKVPEKKLPINLTPPQVAPTQAESKDADKPAASDNGKYVTKIKNLLQKGEVKTKELLNKEVKAPEAVPAPEVKVEAKAVVKKPAVKSAKKKRTEKYINSVKKRNLKKRLEAEKRQKMYERRHAEKAKKLQELRDKYLIKINQDYVAENEVESDEDSDEKIVPQKKNLNRFLSEEAPPMPIANRFRTADNLHIPIILTDQERQNTLFDAVASGSIAFFNGAYKDIDNPNIKNQLGDTLLTYSILLQKYPVMASVLAKGADPNMTNSLGYSPMDIAIELLDIRALEILVNNKSDINEIDSFGRTPLMHATRVGFLPAVELLVSKGADVNTMDNDGFTALSIAYRHKKEIIVKFLLKNGAKTWIEKPYNPEEHSLIQELENHWK